MGLMTNLRTIYQLFLDSKRIQIRSKFYVGPSFITVTGPTNLYAFSPFSLSLKIILDASLSLSFSQPLQRAKPLHYAYPPPKYFLNTLTIPLARSMAYTVVATISMTTTAPP